MKLFFEFRPVAIGQEGISLIDIYSFSSDGHFVQMSKTV